MKSLRSVVRDDFIERGRFSIESTSGGTPVRGGETVGALSRPRQDSG
jgi:hypothetical protein